MSFSIDLSNSDQSIKETNKDMNNQKIINPYNPIDHQDKVTKKYVDEKTENWFILFSVKICPQKSSHWDIHQGKSNMLVSHVKRWWELWQQE